MSASKGSLWRKLVFIKLYINKVMTADMLKMFFTGFYDINQRRTILNLRSIANHYLKTYFVVDLLIILHAYSSFFLKLYTELLSHNMTAVFLLRLFYMLRIIRARRLMGAWNLFCSYNNVPNFFRRGAQLVIFGGGLLWLYAVIMEIEAALDYWSGSYGFRSSYRPFYSVTLMLMHVSYGDKSIDYVHTIVLSLITLSIGYVLQMFLFARILEVCSDRTS
ncbi:hypothetical protein JTB14_027366 [Gonioctena quinquepunctata]|nr:hypothetical protein JTB14_027366 [Gonioctena quinquepunctata]